MEKVLDELQDRLLKRLQSVPEGIREYDLIQQLHKEPDSLLNTDPFQDNLSLFQTHFILFHVLYRLQQQVSDSKQFRLEISSLLIQLIPYTDPVESQVKIHDPVRDYYLDLDHLSNTNHEDVERLLESFWRRFAGLENRQSALQILELNDPVSDDEIKLQYRRLAMQHHPDRGGEKEMFQKISLAGRWLGIIG